MFARSYTTLDRPPSRGECHCTNARKLGDGYRMGRELRNAGGEDVARCGVK